mgnify:CR=1 FL=1
MLTETFSYDALNRLTNASVYNPQGGYGCNYAYNDIGNLISEDGTGSCLYKPRGDGSSCL